MNNSKTNQERMLNTEQKKRNPDYKRFRTQCLRNKTR